MTSPYIRLELAEYGTTNVPVDAPVDVPVNPVEDWDCQIILEEYMVSEKDRLVNKSIEAFILGLEIYNKPTIRYRVEGFSFFVVNAWELMLKAEMLNRGLSIFYRDNPNRTVTVEIVKELKDPSNTHKYSFQSVLTVVAEKMKKENMKKSMMSSETMDLPMSKTI